MSVKEVPFVANSPDDTHCFQASLAMVVGYFEPFRKMGFDELDLITAKPEGQWTWPMAGLSWFASNGYVVRHIEQFDFNRFAKEGKPYLVELYGADPVGVMDENSDIAAEVANAVRFQSTVRPEYRVPAVEDMRKLLGEGYVLICTVNAKILNGQDGFVGHFVVVYDIRDDTIVFHDPGLPPQKARSMPLAEFEKAWAYPEKKDKVLTAIKKL